MDIIVFIPILVLFYANIFILIYAIRFLDNAYKNFKNQVINIHKAVLVIGCHVLYFICFLLVSIAVVGGVFLLNYTLLPIVFKAPQGYEWERGGEYPEFGYMHFSMIIVAIGFLSLPLVSLFKMCSLLGSNSRSNIMLLFIILLSGITTVAMYYTYDLLCGLYNIPIMDYNNAIIIAIIYFIVAFIVGYKGWKGGKMQSNE
jgi:hypothetical protein